MTAWSAPVTGASDHTTPTQPQPIDAEASIFDETQDNGQKKKLGNHQSPYLIV